MPPEPAHDISTPMPLKAIDPATIEALATRLLIDNNYQPFSLGLTSVEHGEGVTTMAANLALCMAERLNRRVVLVELGLGQPAFASLFGVRGSPGVAEVLDGRAAPLAAIVSVGKQLSLVTAGETRSAPAAVVADPRLATLQGLLLEQFDVVLYDCPPVRRFGETTVAASTIGKLAVVIGAERTRQELVEGAVRDIEEAGGHIAGIILNRQRRYVPDWLYRRL